MADSNLLQFFHLSNFYKMWAGRDINLCVLGWGGDDLNYQTQHVPNMRNRTGVTLTFSITRFSKSYNEKFRY